MNFSQINRYFKINSFNLYESHKKARDKLFNELKFNSGLDFKKLSYMLRDEIKDFSDIYIKSIKKNLVNYKSISDSQKNQLLNKHQNIIQNQLNSKMLILKNKLNATNFPRNSIISTCSNLKYITNQLNEIAKEKILLIIDELNSKTSKKHENTDNNTITNLTDSKSIWLRIKKDYDLTKISFGKKIFFISDRFKKKIIFRDIEHAYILAQMGFSKSSIILSGSIIEELLRLYLDYKNINYSKKSFDCYIKTCTSKGVLKTSLSKLSDATRHFRNFVHINKEKNNNDTLSKATAIGAFTNIITISNDFK